MVSWTGGGWVWVRGLRPVGGELQGSAAVGGGRVAGEGGCEAVLGERVGVS